MIELLLCDRVTVVKNALFAQAIERFAGQLTASVKPLLLLVLKAAKLVEAEAEPLAIAKRKRLAVENEAQPTERRCQLFDFAGSRSVMKRASVETAWSRVGIALIVSVVLLARRHINAKIVVDMSDIAVRKVRPTVVGSAISSSRLMC